MDYLITILIRLPVVLIAITLHEFAHGFVAYKMGDYTAKYMGRLSLNPIKHIDVIGAISMLLFGLGWAKPIPVDARRFKRPKLGMALTALAGPVMNVLLGIISCFICTAIEVNASFTEKNFGYYMAYAAVTFFYNMSMLNFGLALFNLIPIPPLDGSRIFLSWLPEESYFSVMKYERFIALGFILLLLVDSRLLGGNINYGLSYVISHVFDFFYSIFARIF